MDRREDRPSFDVAAVRTDFPILSIEMNGEPLVFLDNAATTQKPRAVIDAISNYYETGNANIHRGVYKLSRDATDAFDAARTDVARFIGASDSAECIFVRGVTEAVNLVAMSWGRTFLQTGDEILLSALEHHSNIVPWQLAAEATGAVVRTLPMTPTGGLDYDRLGEFIGDKTKIVAIQHVSNALGVVHDVDRIIAAAKAVGAVVLLDGAQSVGHFPVDVQQLGCDLFCFSGHKLFGPTGVGVLWGKRALLDSMPPYHGGGDMIESVTWQKSTYAPLPNKFEAGTPDIAGVIGLGAAVRYVEALDRRAIERHEAALLAHADKRLADVPGLRILGAGERRVGVASFVLEDPPISSLDVGIKLDARGIAVRTGHHCAQPLMDAFGISGTARASFAFYNSIEEVDALADALLEIVEATTPVRQLEATDMTYPTATAGSVAEAAAAIAEEFELVGEMMKPNEYVLDFADKLPPMPSDLKNDATRVTGCMSTVHLAPQIDGDRITFLADSDAQIVRGLIAVLQRLFAGQRAEEILAFDVRTFFQKIGLEGQLSHQRRSGLAGMIGSIRTHAMSLTDTTNAEEAS